jgi:hypothetical protein
LLSQDQGIGKTLLGKPSPSNGNASCLSVHAGRHSPSLQRFEPAGSASFCAPPFLIGPKPARSPERPSAEGPWSPTATVKTASGGRFHGGIGLHNNINSVFCSSFWRGRPSPRAYFVGRYPFQRGHPATPRAQDAHSFQDSPPAATAALPDSFLTLAAASSQLVTCEAPSFHCRSNAGGGTGCLPPTFHLAGILGELAPCRSLVFLPALPWLPAVRPSRIVGCATARKR